MPYSRRAFLCGLPATVFAISWTSSSVTPVPTRHAYSAQVGLFGNFEVTRESLVASSRAQGAAALDAELATLRTKILARLEGNTS
jgi:hypothetical protein